MSEYWDKNKDTINRKRRDLNKTKEGKTRYMLTAAKTRAKQQGLPFDITLEDIVIPDTCPVLGIPLEIGNSRLLDGSPTLDKFIPELGYVPGNINVISNKANRMKTDASADEVSLLLNWMLEKCKASPTNKEVKCQN